MRALFINSKDQTITVIDINEKDVLSQLYKLIDCRNVDAVRLLRYTNGYEETMWIDDEGLLCNPTHGFRFLEGPIFAGNAVVLATDHQGENVGTLLTVEDLKRTLRFQEFSDDNPAPTPSFTVTTWP